MNNIYISILLVFFVSSCSYLRKDDDKIFEQQQKRIRLDSLYLLYDSMPALFNVQEFIDNRTDSFYYNVYKDSMLIKYRQIRNTFIKEISYNTSTLVERSFYDSTGIIQKKLYTINPEMDIPYGKKFEYDKKGKLINVTDRFPEFKFTFDKLIAVLDSMELYNNYVYGDIYIDPDNNKYYWKIDIGFHSETELYFDTETGELFENIP